MLQVSQIPLIKIELTPNIAAALRTMVEVGVFDIRGGNAVLSFTPTGELKSIKKETFYHAKTVDNSLTP
jgi:hypothetical protein